MTSLFELPGRMAEMPLDLIANGRRGVSLLEFLPVHEHLNTALEVEGFEEEFEVDERAAQVRAMIEAAREEATAEARRGFEWEMETRLGRERARVEQVCAEFKKDRERYFAAAETQVVRLALATARRVLAREVEAKGMHLAATVRAALSRVQDGSSPVVRVRSEDAEVWRAMFSGGGEMRVEVVGDDGMVEGECAIDTNVGRVELGVEVQMREVERGFGELMHRGD